MFNVCVRSAVHTFIRVLLIYDWAHAVTQVQAGLPGSGRVTTGGVKGQRAKLTPSIPLGQLQTRPQLHSQPCPLFPAHVCVLTFVLLSFHPSMTSAHLRVCVWGGLSLCQGTTGARGFDPRPQTARSTSTSRGSRATGTNHRDLPRMHYS